jgi:hypothetical protein
MAGHTVPKAMRRMQEEWNGLPLRYVAVIIGTAIIVLALIVSIFSATYKIIPLILLFIVIAFFLKFMRSPALLTRSWMAYNFMIRGLQGKNVVAKYTQSAAFMKSIVPIINFHEKGLIEFTGNKWGLLLKVDPSRVSDDELEKHIGSVRLLCDSLHGEIMIKSYVVSLPTAARPIEHALMNQLNEPGRTKEEQEHIYSLYQAASENTAPVIQWQYYIFLGLGKYSTLQDAIIAKQQYYFGIIDRLTNAGMHIVLIENKNELGATYRKLISQVQT